ncbi:hypothetical protein HYS49_02965, partial [Candidatus Woesearchaeota archaeon]|nr:hypothetical protein [Candidatus Woesearchaeota archaeon]
MIRIIPRELIRHLEWTPGKELPQKPLMSPTAQPVQQTAVCIGDILNGRTFYSEETDAHGTPIGVAVALQETLDFAGAKGYVANMPEFIAAKAKADKKHDFWKKWYTVHSEENIGIDTKGRFYHPNEAVLVVFHGGGILTPQRIRQAYDEGLLNHSAKYREEEFDALLEGKLLDGTGFPLYRLEEIQAGVSGLPHQFGVVMPYQIAQATKSGWHKKKAFLENPLVVARVGGLEHLETYFTKAKHADGTVGNWHPFN